MQHIPVESNLLASVAYDGTIMQVLYRRGGLYNSENVTIDEFERVLNPGPEFEHSVGKAYNAIIKNHKPTFKVEAGQEKKPLWDEAGNHQRFTDPRPVPEFVAPTPEPPAVLPAEAEAVNHKALELTQQAQDIVVDCPEAQKYASEILLVIASMRREIETTFKPMKDAAYRAHKVICDQEKLVDRPLDQAERLLKGRIGAYELEQKRLAAQADEQRRKDEQARAEAEAAQRAEEQAINQAIELESRGEVAAAQQVLSNPAPVPVRYVAPAPVAPAVAQVKGVGTRFEWAGRITNADLIPREYMIIDEAAINAVIKRTSGKVRIPGVENYERPVVSASRRAR